MTLNDQRRLLIFRRPIIRILRRVKETVSREPALSRKLDRTRYRKESRVNLEIVRLAQNLKRARAQVKAHDRSNICRRSTAKHGLAVCSPHKLNIRVWTINVRYL